MTSTTVSTEQAQVPAHRVVNTRVRRGDAKEKILGTTRYAADFELRGMLHAGLVRSPLPSASIVYRDATEALALPGVVAVLFGEDVPSNEIPPVGGGTAPSLAKVLATDRVRFHGEPVAMVLAESRDALKEALGLVDVDYEELPVLSDPIIALEPGAPLVHKAGNLIAEWEIDNGSVDEAMATAHVVIENEYLAQVVDHAYLEPEAGAAWLDDEGVINVRSATQVVEHYRNIATILGLPDSKVRLQAPYLGGGFGGKEDMTVEPYVALGVKHTGRPVKMVWSRQESLTARPKRHPVILRYRTGAAEDGSLVAQDIEIISDGGAYPLLSGTVLFCLTVNATGPYRCDNVRVKSRSVHTNNTPGSAFRGFGGMQPVLAYESQIDAVAKAVGLSRVEIRKRTAMTKGEKMTCGQELDTAVWLPQCIDAVVEALGPKPEPLRPGGLVGFGLGCNLQPFGRPLYLHDTASAWVGFERDGGVVVRCGVPDVGAGQVSSLAQIAAEILCVEVDDVTVHFGDSARTPLAGTTTATRQLLMSGNATVKAATALRDQVLAGVAAATGLPHDDLAWSVGGVVTPDGVIGIVEVLRMCQVAAVATNAMETYFQPGAKAPQRLIKDVRVFPDVTFGAHGAWVEVDPETGHVEVRDYVACHDVGRAINPLSVEGQISGAVAQGLGYALSERIVYVDGQNLTGAFYQYSIPTSADLPDIRTIILESGEGRGPFGARGIGEPPIGPCASAMASAVEDAVGARPKRLPLLSEVVLECVDEAVALRG